MGIIILLAICAGAFYLARKNGWFQPGRNPLQAKSSGDWASEVRNETSQKKKIEEDRANAALTEQQRIQKKKDALWAELDPKADALLAEFRNTPETKDIKRSSSYWPNITQGYGTVCLFQLPYVPVTDGFGKTSQTRLMACYTPARISMGYKPIGTGLITKRQGAGETFMIVRERPYCFYVFPRVPDVPYKEAQPGMVSVFTDDMEYWCLFSTSSKTEAFKRMFKMVIEGGVDG